MCTYACGIGEQSEWAPVEELKDDGAPALFAIIVAWDSARNGIGSLNLGGGGTGLLGFASLGAGGGTFVWGGAEDAAARAAPLHAHIQLQCVIIYALQIAVQSRICADKT